MNRYSCFVPVFALAALAAAAPPAHAAEARLDAQCQPHLSPLQHRLLQKAAEGPDRLRQFVWMTRGIYGLNIEEEWSRAYVEVQHAVSECQLSNATTAAAEAGATPALAARSPF